MKKLFTTLMTLLVLGSSAASAQGRTVAGAASAGSTIEEGRGFTGVI